jgi:tRNA(Ile)-lysidine synthase
VLRTENPAIDQALANLAELAREDEARWQVELGRILPQLLLPGKPARGGGRAAGGAAGESVAIEVERLRGLDLALRRRVLRAAARTLGARISFDETVRLLALAGLAPGVEARGGAGSARTGAAHGGVLQLCGGLRAERSVREIRLFLESAKKPAAN